MKRTLSIFLLLLAATFSVVAQVRYEVETDVLTAYSEPNSHSTEVGKFGKGVKVEVQNIDGDWAEIKHDGRVAYIKANYIRKVEDSNRITRSVFRNDGIFSGIDIDLSGIAMHNLLPSNTRWMAIAILLLSIALFVFSKIRSNGEYTEKLFKANWIIFLILSLLELTYIPASGSDSTWFCSPDEVGWLWTIANFFIFGFIAIMQCRYFFETMSDLKELYGDDFKIKLGTYSWIGIVIVTIVLSFLQPNWIPIALVIFLICQVIQMIIIVKDVMEYENFWKGLGCAFLYLILSAATVAVLLVFIMMIIIIIIVLIILAILFAGKSKD